MHSLWMSPDGQAPILIGQAHLPEMLERPVVKSQHPFGHLALGHKVGEKVQKSGESVLKTISNHTTLEYKVIYC